MPLSTGAWLRVGEVVLVNNGQQILRFRVYARKHVFCIKPQATHQDLANKLYTTNNVSQSARFSKPKLSQTEFTIAHYAGPVTYRTDNFLDKNKDFVVAEQQELLGNSSYAFVQALFPADAAGDDGKVVVTCIDRVYSDALLCMQAVGKAQVKFASVGSRFKGQLADLMTALNAMEPHYIRCIKPNSFNRPSDFENNNVLHQLRCGGVLEAVRIRCEERWPANCTRCDMSTMHLCVVYVHLKCMHGDCA